MVRIVFESGGFALPDLPDIKRRAIPRRTKAIGGVERGVGGEQRFLYAVRSHEASVLSVG